MKTLKLIACGAAIALSACSTGEKYTVRGTWDGGEGQTVYLKIQGPEPKQMVVIDSATVNPDKSFLMKGKVAAMQPAQLFAGEQSEHLLLFASKRPVEVNITSQHKKTLKRGDADSTEVVINDFDFIVPDPEQTVYRQGKDLASLNAFLSVGKMFMAMRLDTGELTLDSLQAVFKAIDENIDENVSRYFDTTQNYRATTYFIKEYVLPQRSLAEAKQYYDRLAPAVKESAPGKDLLEAIGKIEKVNIGGVPDDFTLPTPDGGELSLYSLRGHIVLLDFWASWCAPCLAEAPNVKAIYEKYHDKGLEVLGVSLDNEGDHDKWTAAIDKHGLNWKHVSSLKGWDCPIAKRFNVTGIPRMYILDAEGKIIAQDLRGEELARKMDELFAQ